MNENTMAILAHILGLLTSFIGPLVIYLVAEDPRTKAHGASALNWQISFVIYSVACVPLVFLIIGIPLIFALAIADLVFCIVAAVKASNGELWNYPLSIPFVGK